MLAPKCATYHGRSTFANPKYCKQAQSNKPCLYQIPYDTSDPANRFAPDGEEIVTLSEESRSKLDKDKNTNPHMSKSSGVIHTTSVSRPQLKSYQVKDKVVPNISHVKFTKKEVEDHPRISSISKKTKSVTACNNSLNSRTSNANAVCADWWKINPRVIIRSLWRIQIQEGKGGKLRDVHQFIHGQQKPLRTKKDMECQRIGGKMMKSTIVQLILFIDDLWNAQSNDERANLKLLCNFVEKFLDPVLNFTKERLSRSKSSLVFMVKAVCSISFRPRSSSK
ncbi:hypothetical protein Tco_1006781 [Tanacetum coccineum]|uniref:Uncharacterized protein n=1 Tax=Tanacetum coccineum TaxID=301880 RepID=A0ABQ5FJS1_9ASTR